MQKLQNSLIFKTLSGLRLTVLTGLQFHLPHELKTRYLGKKENTECAKHLAHSVHDDGISKSLSHSHFSSSGFTSHICLVGTVEIVWGGESRDDPECTLQEHCPQCQHSGDFFVTIIRSYLKKWQGK